MSFVVAKPSVSGESETYFDIINFHALRIATNFFSWSFSIKRNALKQIAISLFQAKGSERWILPENYEIFHLLQIYVGRDVVCTVHDE